MDGLRSLFPKALFLLLTATAPPAILKITQDVLLLQDAALLKVSPNRVNIFLRKAERLATNQQEKSHQKILIPIATQLDQDRGNYPQTIIFMRLEYCGRAYQLSKRLIPNSYSEELSMHMFTQYHAHSTSTMKQKVVAELNKRNSFLRVVFATTALGMGVNTEHVSQFHLSRVTAYFQEIRRSGRNGLDATATLYYNANDIARNTFVQESMRAYCLEKGCLRQNVITYFGFTHEVQGCCSHCHASSIKNDNNVENTEIEECRLSPDPQQIRFFNRDLDFSLSEVEKAQHASIFFNELRTKDCKNEIIDRVEYIKEMYCLMRFGISDMFNLAKVFTIVEKYSPLL